MTALGRDAAAMAYVIDRLAEAAATLRALPGATGRPSQRMTAWPEIVRATWEAFGLARDTGYRSYRAPPAVPAAAAIDRADEAFAWLVALDRRAAAIVWLRACGFTWIKIAERCQMTERWARHLYLDAIGEIAKKTTSGSSGTLLSTHAMME